MVGTQFSDRFGLPALFLAALLWVSLVSLLCRSSHWSVVLLFVLIFLGGFRQADEQGKYQIAWVEQKDFSWQLAWRAPAIQTHTAVVSDDQIYPFSRRVFGLNLIYPQPKSGVELPLWNYNLWQEEWLNQDFLKNSQDLSESYRQFWFKGSSKDLLIVHAENGQCLWLLQPLDALDPQLAENMRSLAAYSNISLVQNARASSQPPAEIFGEPALNSWCYDYEKAALGSQQKDWQAVITLQGATQKSGFSPDNPISASPHEWAPFMQAQAASGNQVEAESMLNQLLARHPEYRAYLCAAWNEVAPIPASCAKP
jgi:hypothetical protein